MNLRLIELQYNAKKERERLIKKREERLTEMRKYERNRYVATSQYTDGMNTTYKIYDLPSYNEASKVMIDEDGSIRVIRR